MSAFVLNKGHIDAMLRAGLAYSHASRLYWYTSHPGTIEQAQELHRELRSDTADQIGAMLVAENVRSVCYRYEKQPTDELPGPGDSYWLRDYHYDPRGPIPTPVAALKLVDCYEYQSCEHPEWEGSEASRFCDALRRKLIDALPGYEEAAWEWRDQQPAAPPPTPTAPGPAAPGFPLGRMVITRALEDSLREAQPTTWFEDLQIMVARHAERDWGEVPPEDKATNDQALRDGARLVSAYTSGSGVKVWVITEADRSVTTLLRPEDY